LANLLGELEHVEIDNIALCVFCLDTEYYFVNH